jgi:ribosomal protein S13
MLKGIKGIGPGTINRVDEILRTGSLAELKNYDKIVKKLGEKEQIIDDLTKVVGIGRVMAMNLISKYDIKSADELKRLSDAGKIDLNEKIKIGLKYLGKFEGNIPRKEIDNIYDYLQQKTDEYNSNMCITICGSYRRGLPTSSDIDILLSDLNLNTMDEVLESNALSKYVEYLHKIGFLLDDITDKNIKTKYMGFGISPQLNLKSKALDRFKPKNKIRRVDIRLIPMISYFPALLYFTGSYELNQEMRTIAKKLGYKLNEYGLYKLNTNEMIDILSEQDMFLKLNMNYLEPNKR